MTRSGCNIFFFKRKRHSVEDCPGLARRRGSLRGPKWPTFNIRLSLTTSVNRVCCASSLGLVRVQAQRQHLKGAICHCCACLGDMWRSRVLFWRTPLPNAGQLTTVATVRNLSISMINFDPRPRHTRQGGRNINPHSIVGDVPHSAFMSD